jgi:rRNA maturation RNase YbeY
LFAKEGFKVAHLNFVFCSDEYLLLLNKSHLNHNTYTDIITFPFSNEGEAVLSDIYISVERVKENAENFSQSFKRELHRVIFHGVLHLCGYKDKTLSEKKMMREKETYYLDEYFT